MRQPIPVIIAWVFTWVSALAVAFMTGVGSLHALANGRPVSAVICLPFTIGSLIVVRHMFENHP